MQFPRCLEFLARLFRAFDVQVSDGNGGSDTIPVNVTVNNVAPVFNSSSTAAFQENGTGTVLDVNADNGGDGTIDSGVNYSLSGGADQGLFSINTNTGELALDVALDYENPSDSDGNNDYVVDVTVDDGAASNNTASDNFALTVNAVPDLTITDGSVSGLDFTSDVSPSTPNNPIGIFELTAGQNGASFDGVTVTNKNPGVSGISAARLYWSDDQTLEPGSDTQLDEATSLNASSAPSTISFSGFSQSIQSATRYVILAIDVQAGASEEVQFELAQDGDLQTPDGEIATVNGNNTSTFSALPLSNGTTALPVELSRFDATTSESEAVTLRWQTASETDNAGSRYSARQRS